MLFVACNSEDTDDPVDLQVYAGKTHDGMMLKDSLNQHIDVVLDSRDNYFIGSDSLDLNLDEDFDLYFNLVFPAADTFNENMFGLASI